jgi:hydrogenase nickel incorporation protein HypA/HybF
MHELGIAQDFWKIIKQHAEANGLKAVTKIVIVLGEASGIEEDFLRHSLKDHALPGTIAEKAEIAFVRKTLSACCRDCGRVITKDSMLSLCCPQCGGRNIDIVSGKEAHVESIEGA